MNSAYQTHNKALSSLLSAFVYLGLNMSVSAVALLLFVATVLQVQVSVMNTFIFFCGVWWAYIFDRWSCWNHEDKESHPQRAYFFQINNTLIKSLLFIIPVLILVIGIYQQFSAMLLLLFVGAALVAFFYSRGVRGKRLKSSGLNKTFLVALGWCLGLFLFLGLSSEQKTLLSAWFEAKTTLLFLLIFLLLFVDTYLLDVQDYNVDSKYKVSTSASNKILRKVFSRTNKFLSGKGEVHSALWVSSWRYLLFFAVLF